MIVLVLCLLALGASCAEPVFIRPTTWLGDLAVGKETLLIGTTGQVLEVNKKGEILRSFSCPAGQVRAVILGPGFLAAGGWNFLRVWDWPSGEMRWEAKDFGTMIQDLAFTESLILAAGADGRVLAFSLAEGKVQWSIRAHEGSVWGIAACGNLFATAGTDRAALWDLRGQKEIFTFPGKTWDVDFSPDGFLLAGGAGKILKVWDTALGLPLFEVWAHESCTIAVAFSPDGKRLGTGSLDCTAAAWDAETGALIWRSPGFSAIVRAVGFSQDGQLFVAAAEDGTIAILPLP